MFKRFLPLLAVIVCVGFATRVQAQTCTGSMSVTIDGSASGSPLSCTAAVTSLNNGAHISCNPANGSFGTADGEATVTPSGGTSPYTYLWSDAQTNAIATGLTAGTYTVVVTDASSCTTICTVTLAFPPAIVAGTCLLVEDGCQVNAGSIKIDASGGTGALSLSWSGTANLPFLGPPAPGSPASPQSIGTGPVGGSVTVTGLSGNSTYNFIVTDANGCTNP